MAKKALDPHRLATLEFQDALPYRIVTLLASYPEHSWTLRTVTQALCGVVTEEYPALVEGMLRTLYTSGYLHQVLGDDNYTLRDDIAYLTDSERAAIFA